MILICVHCWRKLLAATVYCWWQGGNGCDSTRHGPWSAWNRKLCPTVLYYLRCGGDCREELWDSSRIKSCLFLLEVNLFLTLSCTVCKAKEVSESWPVAPQCDIAVPIHNQMVIGHLNCSTASCTVMWPTKVVSTYMHSCCCHQHVAVQCRIMQEMHTFFDTAIPVDLGVTGTLQHYSLLPDSSLHIVKGIWWCKIIDILPPWGLYVNQHNSFQQPYRADRRCKFYDYCRIW